MPKYKQDLREAADATWGWSLVLIVLGILGIFAGTGFYFWQRNIGSNLERDLRLNSAQRETSGIIRISDMLTQCESQEAQLALLKAERDQYDQDSEAYRLADINFKGSRTFFAQCQSELRGIIETTEVETIPEFIEVSPVTGSSLKSRVQAILAE